MIIKLKHGRVGLALHRQQSGEGTPLLLLHQLGGCAHDWSALELGWTGPVYALDLSGHGRSGHVRGGGYLAELWAADADVALCEIGEDAVLVGAGVSAFVALLLAGARPDSVRGALLLPGRGLAGGGPEPDFSQVPQPITGSGESGALRAEPMTDPAVRFSESIVRPVDYARALAQEAGPAVLCEDREARPAWWRALHDIPQVHVHHGDCADALALLATHIGCADQSVALRSMRSA
jgi:pimeloyl-ACP methyl ester carboxylesterase